MILFPLNLAGLDDQQTPDGHQGHRRKQFSQYSHFSSSRSFRFEAMKTRTSASTHAHGNVKSAKETFVFAGLIFPPFVFLSIPLPLKTPVKHPSLFTTLLLVDSSAVQVRTIHWTMCTSWWRFYIIPRLEYSLLPWRLYSIIPLLKYSQNSPPVPPVGPERAGKQSSAWWHESLVLKTAPIIVLTSGTHRTHKI